MTNEKLISELINALEVLCDTLLDLPCGCEVCGLKNDDGTCEKEKFYEYINKENYNEI